ncbi:MULTISPECIES: hypothetical protein [unclassified Streptomyces]|uniref:hypothetical protein n=1 Tax=unclassified Streptomyces TaxID=2593676 RepID=UPI00081B52B9|nr:hypothetical protein [Streptomyces sp. DvalAA-43]MYQ88131.1 hypothetical protein [Streptomyces sp. SID4936]SCE52846.1 hypothetical protein GA0115234_1104192 [Streptomyces sp. DvalAA-43]
MPASELSVEDIAARLSAAGLTTRVMQHAHHTSIEAEVPDDFPADSWREVLDAVAEADRFGLFASNVDGRALWAAVHKAVPATGDVRGPGHQR